jgi:hypothetical protein
MVEVVAVWGALTGTAGLGLAGWRELRNQKKNLNVEWGFQYIYHRGPDGDYLGDIWVCVSAWNDGRRTLSIEHAGFEFLVPAPSRILSEHQEDLPEGMPVLTNVRFEIALNDETIDVIPDGPAVKIWARIGPILKQGIDPTEARMRAFVVTVRESYWWSKPGLLVHRTDPGRDLDETKAAVKRLITRALDGELPIPPAMPGQLYSMQRLILEGEVEHSRDLDPNRERDERKD